MFGNKQKPVYVINGFLDSGKSTFFSYTIGQPYFRAKGKTLLILCEEGEVEYTPALLKQTNTVVETFESAEELTPAAMMALDAKYDPERILVEWNGMWDFRSFKLPKKWMLEQQITTIDASTFSKTLISYKRNIKAINQKAELIFEDANGEIDMTTEEDLPFSLNEDPIRLEGLNYGIWYIDAMEHPDRYVGKNITYTGQILKPGNFPQDMFVPGRMAMTCCAQDMQFLGYAARFDGARDLKERDWVKVTANVGKEFFEPYGREGVVLSITQAEKTKEPKNAVIDFSQPA